MKRGIFSLASRTGRQPGAETVGGPPERILSLRTSMTRSFIGATGLLVGLLEILLLIGLATLVSSVIVPFVSTLQVQRSAERYALAAMLQARDGKLDPQSTFRPGLPGTLTLSGTAANAQAPVIPYNLDKTTTGAPSLFALLIASDGAIQASSAPATYAQYQPFAQVLPSQESQVRLALQGNEESAVASTEHMGKIAFAIAPIWDRQSHSIGALYVQMRLPTVFDLLSGSPGFTLLLVILILAALLLLPPLGGLFGMLTTRRLVQRIRQLEAATERLADGDYTQRIISQKPDELGQLEQHFNRMAYKLTLSLEHQRTLTEQHTRQRERARISRDLHDNIKQQIFALAAQIAISLVLLGNNESPLRKPLEIANELAYQARQDLTAFIQGIRELSPAPAQDVSQRLAELCTIWQRQSNIAVDLHLQALPSLPAEMQEQLQCLLQEALSNIARHSLASRVEINLEVRAGNLFLSVIDNGCGFDKKAVRPQCLGLRSMHERVAELGGQLTIESQPGQGTYLRASCPLVSATL